MYKQNSDKDQRLVAPNKKRFLVYSLGVILAALLWPTANAQAAVYSFNLINPMTTTNNAGDTLRMDGAGTFDDVADLVRGSGHYTITDSAGNVTGRGTWVATDFVSFESDGGPNKGLQGGDLSLEVTLVPDGGGTPVEGVPMTLECPYDNGVFDGPGCNLFLADFVNPAGGVMVFHLIRP